LATHLYAKETITGWEIRDYPRLHGGAHLADPAAISPM
jgi:hypothetical protein